MQISAVEENELMQDITEREHQPEAAETASLPETQAAQPETQEQEITALVSTEPEVVDGEVVELEPQTEHFDTPQLPKQKPYWLFIPFTIFCCLVFVAVSSLLPQLNPTATIAIIPVERSITTTATIQVPGRLLPVFTLSQTTTAKATGKRHQNATRATGTITFYNGLFSHQTVGAGTILTGQDGVHVITDQPAIIPPANPPYIGQVTVRAHALDTGRAGNIQAYDINQACCVTAVKAVNTTAFTGGERARDYVVVTHQDIDGIAGTIKTTLDTSEQAALEAQITAREALITPLCSEKITTDHRIGDEATNVTVTVYETCSGIAYHAHDVYTLATQLLPSTAKQTLGANYTPIRPIQVHIIQAIITNQARGIATLAVKLDATYVYQLNPGEKGQLVKLIAGKSKQQAQSLLSKAPGIAGTAITMNGSAATLPADPGKIKIVVVYRSVSM